MSSQPVRPSSKPTSVRVTGTRSLEVLSHFRCGACRKWWSVGDAPKRRRWFCPWCGEENSFGKSQARTA